MKEFRTFREAYSNNHHTSKIGSGGGIHSGSGDGHSDGQSDSNADRKRQDKDYNHLLRTYEFEDEKVYRELINLYRYKKQIASKTVMRNNPDIKKIDSRGNITYR